MNKRLNSELSVQLYKQAPFVSVSLFALLGVALYFFWDVLPHYILLSWSGVNFTLAVALLLLVRSFRKSDGGTQAASWIQRYTYLAMLQDISWGLIGPISFMVENEVYRLLTLFMLGGMAAGGIATRGVIFKTYAASIIPLLSPMIITLALQGDPVSEGMFVLTLIYLLFMLSVAKSYSTSIKKNMLLWLDNEKLITELRRSKGEVEDANQVLTREIEQRKRIEDELVDAKERAERASAAKNQFLASVSHELRTPLNGIIGFTSILENERLTDEHQRYVNQIGKSANTLLRIVNDILDITAIEAGHLTLYEEPFSLRTEIGEVVAILRPLAERKQLTLEYSVADEVPDWLNGDPNRLRQIISNLLSNAVKYTDNGWVRLRISAQGEKDGKPLINFEVEDSGIGIPDDAITSLFDNFTRVEGFETRHNDGVGLGLAIVRNLLQQMNGRIHVDSEPGEGSSFTVELPFAHGTRVPREQEQELVEGEPLELKGVKVLVVDDNDVNRMVLCAFLAHNAIEYDEATTGSEALQKIRAHDYDVVLLDIQMPDISGIEVARQVMSMEKDIPTLIAVTAHAFPEQREAIINAGFTEFLIKPIAEDALIKTLRRLGSGERGGRAGKRINL